MIVIVLFLIFLTMSILGLCLLENLNKIATTLVQMNDTFNEFSQNFK